MRKFTLTEVKTQILAAKPALFRAKQAQAVSDAESRRIHGRQASKVSTVATIRPPMMATAMGPRTRCATADHGQHGCGRRQHDGTQPHGSLHNRIPGRHARARPLSIWSIRITELR
jgi:hypothetical protein